MQVISVNNQYASGLRRLGAFFIDHLAISLITGLFFWQFLDWPFNDWNYPFYGDGWKVNFSVLGHNVFNEIIVIIYYALMESSKHQATLGKIALGIKVVNERGERVDFAKALLRNLSKILSALILGIGYIMIIFDDRKQGLHDKIADTFVVKAN